MLGELDGEQVTVQNGRYGPYVKKGTDSRSLESEDQLFTLDPGRGQGAVRPAEAPRPRRRAAAPPLRELGADPATGKPMVIKDGRFGPYVTDGETNASLRKGDEVAAITVERAAELLADRRWRPRLPAAGAKRPPATRQGRARQGCARQDATAKTTTTGHDHQEGGDSKAEGCYHGPFGIKKILIFRYPGRSPGQLKITIKDYRKMRLAVPIRLRRELPRREHVRTAPTGRSSGAAPPGAIMPASRAFFPSSRSGGCGSRCRCRASVTG